MEDWKNSSGWGLAASSSEVHPVGDLAVCKAVRSLSKGSFFLWGRLGVGTCSIFSSGEPYFEVPD